MTRRFLLLHTRARNNTSQLFPDCFATLEIFHGLSSVKPAIVARRIRLVCASYVRQFTVEAHKPVICAMHMHKPDRGSQHVNAVFVVTGKSTLSVADYACCRSSSTLTLPSESDHCDIDL